MAAINFVELPGRRVLETFDEAVRIGLSAAAKHLPSRFFYDAAGSELFEQITALPEYYLTRCEHEILARHAAEIVAEVGAEIMLIEFGCGNSAKTRLLIEAALQSAGRLHYVPIDISATYLRSSMQDLASCYPELTITALAAEYHDAIPHLPQQDLPRLLLFMGSNIGNFESRAAAEFLGAVRRGMAPGDRLLIGFDLVKDPTRIEAAYNDAAGLTARFNKNVLARINAELGGTFELDGFDHHAPYLDGKSRIEMRLISRRRQIVKVCALGEAYTFSAGESIHTENSHKYTGEAFAALAGAAGLEVAKVWTDERNWFAVALLEPMG